MDHFPSPALPLPREPRKQGGQPGNLNALKHGFYSSRFLKRELTDLEASSFKGLDEEIALLRIFTRRLAECHTPAADIYDTILVVRTLCLSSSSCLNCMVKTRRLLASTAFRDEFDESLEQALGQVGVKHLKEAKPLRDASPFSNPWGLSGNQLLPTTSNHPNIRSSSIYFTKRTPPAQILPSSGPFSLPPRPIRPPRTKD